MDILQWTYFVCAMVFLAGSVANLLFARKLRSLIAKVAQRREQLDEALLDCEEAQANYVIAIESLKAQARQMRDAQRGGQDT